MQCIPIDEIIFCHTHKQIAVTRADFTRTSVTVPSVTRQSNSRATEFVLSAPKEVFISKNFKLKFIQCRLSAMSKHKNK